MVVGSQRQPGSDLTEARVGTVVPLHRRALGVTPAAETGQAPLHRVLDRLGRNRHVLHADLVALVQRRRAAQGQQQQRGHARLRSADAAGHALPVVIAEHPVRPGAGRQRRLVRVDERGDVARVPGAKDQVEVEWQMQAAAANAVVGHQPLDRQPQLADQHALGVRIREIANLSDQLQQLGLIGGMSGQQRLVLAPWSEAEHGRRLRRRPAGVRRVVAQLDVLEHLAQGVDTETIDAAFEPEAQHIQHGGAYFRVAPVEVRLLLQVGVIVELTRWRVPLPGAAAEHAQPVVGR